MTPSAFGYCGDALLRGHRLGPPRRRGGAPAGTGLTLSMLVARTIERREPVGGGWPSQAAVAWSLGLSIERVRQVGLQAGGWQGVIRLAAAAVGEARDGLGLGSLGLTSDAKQLDAG